MHGSARLLASKFCVVLGARLYNPRTLEIDQAFCLRRRMRALPTQGRYIHQDLARVDFEPASNRSIPWYIESARAFSIR